MKILVTGANGFIGYALCNKLLSDHCKVKGIVRSKSYNDRFLNGIDISQLESIGPETDWSEAINGMDYVVHLAGRVHVMPNDAQDPFSSFREINVAATERLAREAALANVKRFIYISSVKVSGEGKSTPYNEEDIPTPQDAYGISKWEAEKVLNKIYKDTGMEIVILRSPLVYGPRVKANFLRLLKIVDRGFLPLASINNRRSLIYLGNLVDAIVTCMEHPKAAGQTYFVSDGEDVSTPELIRRISSAMGRPARLLPFPLVMLKLAGFITGQSIAMDRFLKSLTIDCSKINRELDWQAPFSMEQGLRETARWYKKSR
ncbi:MAG: UDP-glucose 4-epimerase family protein [Candidatus Hodarchaeota archaeon]